MCYEIDITSDSPGRVFPSQSCNPGHDVMLIREYLTNTSGQTGQGGIWFNACGYRMYDENGREPLLFYSQVATAIGYRQAYSSTLEEAVMNYDRLRKMEWFDNGFYLDTARMIECKGLRLLNFFGL